MGPRHGALQETSTHGGGHGRDRPRNFFCVWRVGLADSLRLSLVMSKRDSDIPAEKRPGPSCAEGMAAAAEAALLDLERRLPAGMGPLERVEAARIREAARRLLDCAGQLATDELMIRGSTGQRRSHPLLKTEQDSRREISDSLQKLTFRAERRAMYERLMAIHQRGRDAAGDDLQDGSERSAGAGRDGRALVVAVAAALTELQPRQPGAAN